MIKSIEGFRPPIPTAAPPPPTPKPPVPERATLNQSIFPGNKDTMPFYDQGRSNACGTTSEAMILTHLLGRPVYPHDIDHQIRRFDTFTSPKDMVRYARQQGLSAEMYNHGSLSELQGFVARGIPCQALISVDKSGGISGLHYVAVVGFGKDAAGQDCVVVHDPAHGEKGQETFIPLKDFKDQWSAPPGGFENFFIAYAPGSTTLPAGRDDGIEGSLATVDGIAKTTNGFHRLVSPDSLGAYFRSYVQIPTGVAQTVGGALSGAVELGGDWLHKKVQGVPVLQNVVGPVATVISTAGSTGADLVNGISEATDDLGKGVQDLTNGNFAAAGNDAKDAVTDAVSAGVNAVADAGKGAVNVVSDIFSW